MTDVLTDIEEIPGTEFLTPPEPETAEDAAERQRQEWLAMDAPYGRVTTGPETGRPKNKPGRPRKATTRMATPPPKKKPASTATPPKDTTTDYRPGIRGLLGEVVGSMALFGVMRSHLPIGRQLVADAAVVDSISEPVAELGNHLADRYPIVARGLDIVLTIGPYASTGGAVVLGVGQLLVNHGVIPPGMIPGTRDPGTVADEFINRHLADEKSTFGKALRWMAGQQAAREASAEATFVPAAA
jgi:hypothetical protein